MNREILTAGLVQHACTDDYDTNLERSIDGIKQAASQGAQLVLLQELHTIHYFCQTEDAGHFELAESIPGPTTRRLASLARQLNVVVVSSVFEKDPAGVFYNTAVVLDTDGRMAGCYRKMHIPDDPGYHEKYYFTPVDLGFTPIDTSVGRLGVLVCWDQWFPEAARLMALAGADILLYPAAIGYDPRDDKTGQQRQLDAWITVQRGHAIANCLPLLSCNRIGFENDPSATTPGIHFWGNSCIVGPQGEILVHTGSTRPEVLVAEIEHRRSDELRRIWPFFRDRRTDAYQQLLESSRD